METDHSPRTLKTVSRAIEIINLLKERSEVGISEVARELDMSKSSAYNYLETLREHLLVIKREDKYSLSHQFLFLGENVRNDSKLYRIGGEYITELAERTGEYAHLVTEEHGRGVNLCKVKGSNAVGGEYHRQKIQRPDYLHFTATGKAILAFQSEAQVYETIERHGLPAKTKNTITDPQALFEELEKVRERGYAYNDEEEIEGLRAVGAPIRNKSGDVLGSLSLSGPTSRFQDQQFREEIPEKVMRTANIIEVNINMEEDVHQNRS